MGKPAHVGTHNRGLVADTDLLDLRLPVHWDRVHVPDRTILHDNPDFHAGHPVLILRRKIQLIRVR